MVIRGILVLMKGKRSDNNLYELQVGSGSLGHKLDDGVMCGSNKVTFEDKESVQLVGELFSACTKALNKDVNFEHIIEYALVCTLEKHFEYESNGS